MAGGVACDEFGAGELDCVADGLEDAVWLDVEPDEDVWLEHPAVMIAMAIVPASVVRFNRTGHSFASKSVCCTHHTGNSRPERHHLKH